MPVYLLNDETMSEIYVWFQASANYSSPNVYELITYFAFFTVLYLFHCSAYVLYSICIGTLPFIVTLSTLLL